MLFPTTIAGSLPKPEWLAEPNTLWAPWKSSGEVLARAKRDATMLAVKLQEDAGVDIVTEGEQARQHFVHGFLEKIEGIDFAHKVEMGIRKDRYKAMVPQVVAPLRLKGRVHADEARIARTHTARKLKFTLPGPMTIIDTIADKYYGDRIKMAFAFAELLNQEAKALETDGIDVIQFDEPAFNVYMDEVKDWGIKALERAAEGLTCTTAVHICYGYGIKANTDWKQTLGNEWRQYEDIFPAIDNSPIQQVAIECRNSKVPLELLALLKGKVVQAGVIDVASDAVETAEDVVKMIDAVSKFVPKSNIVATTNCGMAPMRREIAEAKLMALGAGAKLARQKLGMTFNASFRGTSHERTRQFLRFTDVADVRMAEDCASRMRTGMSYFTKSLRAWMLHRPISRAKRAQRRRRRQQHRVFERGLGLLIARRRPEQRPALHDQIALRLPAAPSRHQAIASGGIGNGCRRFLPWSSRSRCNTASMSGARTSCDAIALFPCGAKAVGIVAAAIETGAMPCCECGGFIKEEQLGPASAAHHLAPPSPEFADTGQPCRARPAFSEQGFGGGIVDDAAVAGEHAAMRCGDDVTGGSDAILQRHSVRRSFTAVIREERWRPEPNLEIPALRCFASPSQ